MDQVFFFLYGPSAKCVGHENKEGKNEDHNFLKFYYITKLAIWTEQMRQIRCLLYGFADYSSFEKVIELEVHMATYGPGNDQSQHVKSVSHIIIKV